MMGRQKPKGCGLPWQQAGLAPPTHPEHAQHTAAVVTHTGEVLWTRSSGHALGPGYSVSQDGSPAAGHSLACLPCFPVDQFRGLGTEPRALHRPYLGLEMLKWARFGDSLWGSQH